MRQSKGFFLNKSVLEKFTYFWLSFFRPFGFLVSTYLFFGFQIFKKKMTSYNSVITFDIFVVES
jgi:hypothetical protein